jgi:hypothetical protein
MEPTNSLRFVKRPCEPDLDGNRPVKVRILQQWWEETPPTYGIINAHTERLQREWKPKGEWRDVPLEAE